MNNFLAISGSKETIDRVTESIIRKGIQNFVAEVQVDVDNLSDSYSIVVNRHVGKLGSLITFERKNDTEILINISSMSSCNSATIGVAMGLATHIEGVRVSHRFYKKNRPFLGGYFIENRKLESFYCLQSNSEICNALTSYLVQEVLKPEIKNLPNFINFLSRDQRAGICHDYFEDNYKVKIEECGEYYLRISREDASGETLNLDNLLEDTLVVGDVVWSMSEGSVLEGLLDEFIDVSPSKFYHNHVPMNFSNSFYKEAKNANIWSS